MKTEQIIKKISEVPGGRFFRIRYMSQVKIKAEYAKQGITIIKIVDTTTRTGVKYTHINGVVPTTYPDTYEPKKTNWEWVVKNRIKHNTKTGKDYVVVAPINKGNNTITSYVITNNEGVSRTISKEEVKTYTIDSYWREEKPAVMNITLENILMVK